MPSHFHGHAHGHHRSGRGGGRRSHGQDIVYLESVPDAVYCDGSIVNGICIPDRDAGDILPMTSQQLRTAAFAEDQNWDILNQAIVSGIMASKIDVPYAGSFTTRMTAWKYFLSTILTDTPVFNGDAVAQLRTWGEERAKWARDIATKTGVANVPGVADPPPAPPPPSTVTADMTKLVTAVGTLAAMIFVVPKVLSMFK